MNKLNYEKMEIDDPSSLAYGLLIRLLRNKVQALTECLGVNQHINLNYEVSLFHQDFLFGCE